MRIAIPLAGDQVAPHVGHCRTYLIADVEDKQVVRSVEVANPGHGPGGPPPFFLADQGVDLVLAWGIPPHARELFRSRGVDYILGCNGKAADVLQDYLNGTLKLTDEGLEGGGGCHCH
ncbi:putative Fe-Mo cluster-binding NifX family protein [Symbiobacterium terraclitae]|uniref:Fe-Mo cluster-binding NifX family protein n=1 Tax=Symbiobacterium terraclitae TaxID=557451 RepID=A0ABS4JW21_9FIRM|nr:NifB/NifX family molybdenum-iron cluster-binding protein [Symbiobacterium terraclitae]MBP2018619.1 putative Fe-Mo cluster-binding NifX family protein [Symbiobacterium terraclitae]